MIYQWWKIPSYLPTSKSPVCWLTGFVSMCMHIKVFQNRKGRKSNVAFSLLWSKIMRTLYLYCLQVWSKRFFGWITGTIMDILHNRSASAMIYLVACRFPFLPKARILWSWFYIGLIYYYILQRVTSSQRMAESSVLDAHSSEVSSQTLLPFIVFQHWPEYDKEKNDNLCSQKRHWKIYIFMSLYTYKCTWHIHSHIHAYIYRCMHTYVSPCLYLSVLLCGSRTWSELFVPDWWGAILVLWVPCSQITYKNCKSLYLQ